MARRSVRHLRGQRRETDWFGFDFDATSQTGGGASILLSLNAAALAMRPFTVIRTHVELLVVSDQAAAIEVQAGAYGVAIVSDQANAIGVTAVPTPVTDISSDLWLVHQVFFADESNLTDRTKGGARYSIDSKAMRKVNADQDLVVVAENSSVGSGYTLFSGGRLLVKLH